MAEPTPKVRASLTHFVLQSATDFNVHFISGASDVLLNEMSYATILQIKVDDVVDLALSPDEPLSQFKVLCVGTEDEVNDYKKAFAQSDAVNEPAVVNAVPDEAYLEVQNKVREMEAQLANVTTQLATFEARFTAVERKVSKKNLSYERKTENSINELELIVNGEKKHLGDYIDDSSELSSYLTSIQGQFSEIENKFYLNIRGKLKHLRKFVRQHFNRPDLCGYAVMIEFFDVDTFKTAFLPSNPYQVKTRRGQRVKKTVINASFQKLFRAILKWCGVRVFTEDSLRYWMQAACDGVNNRVDQLNCKKAQRHSMKPLSAPVWKSLKESDEWHKRQLVLRPPAESDGESDDSDIENYNTDQPNLHNFNTPM